MKKSQDKTDIPRKTALSVLNTLSQKQHPHLDQIIDDQLDRKASPFSSRDRNFINALIFGVLRYRAHLDWIIAQYSRTPIKKIKTEILNILRLGLYQMVYLDRVPDSAAVNTSVQLAKEVAPTWVIKYVNAVLRNAGRTRNTLVYPSLTDHPTDALCITKSLPEWLVKRWISRFGIDTCATLCDSLNRIPPLTIRCNSLKVSRDELLEMMSQEAETIYPTLYSPDGLSLNHPQKPVYKLPGFETGCFQVQDEAAQLIPYLLAPHPGDRVLDACAGLGGKTGHIAQLMKNEGQVFAVDRDSSKLARLDRAMQRLGIVNVTSLTHDFMSEIPGSQFHEFDRILLDAPCSGLGVIRRNPDTKWDVLPENLNQCNKRQFRLLKTVAAHLKVGGILVYVVCSMEPEENESVIFDFLAAFDNFKIENQFLHLPFDIRQFADSDGFFRSFPHVHDTDGFFAVCLKRIQ